MIWGLTQTSWLVSRTQSNLWLLFNLLSDHNQIKTTTTLFIIGITIKQGLLHSERKWKWKSFSCIWLFVTPRTVWSLPGSSVHRNSPGQNIGVGSRSHLQGIFPTQGSNPGLPHCRRILYNLSLQGSPLLSTLGWYSCLRLHAWVPIYSGVFIILGGYVLRPPVDAWNCA